LNLGFRLSDRYTLSMVIKNLTNTEYMGRPGDIQPQRSFSLRFSGKL
jgi:outer membrane receptor protein involved in Fe transport